MRYKIIFSYNGKHYDGYQKQPGRKTVQEEIEDALTFINNKKKVSIVSSGRTDKGVHALGQVAHFDMDIDITLYKLKCAINSNTSNDIHVISVEEVDDDFHARYMAKEKVYIYRLNMGEFDVLKKDYVYQYNRNLNVPKMQEAIKYFIGVHNFKNFVSDSVVKDSYEREIYDANIGVVYGIVEFYFRGNGFMQYQIRNMVGTLIKVGKGQLDPVVIKELLESDNKKNVVYCAAAYGLCLKEVIY